MWFRNKESHPPQAGKGHRLVYVLSFTSRAQ